MSPPLGDRRLRLLRARDVMRRARALKPDAIIERYYNFGGEGDACCAGDLARSPCSK